MSAFTNLCAIAQTMTPAQQRAAEIAARSIRAEFMHVVGGDKVRDLAVDELVATVVSGNVHAWRGAAS